MILLWLLIAPLAAAAASGLARTRRGMEIANIGGFALTCMIAAAIAAQVLESGTVSFWGGFLYADHLSALVCLLTAAIALVCSVYAVGYLRDDEQSGVLDEEDAAPALSKLRKYYTLTPLFVCAMLLIAVANNLGVMWVAIEATTLASVFLVTLYGRRTSLEAAWKYAIIGGVGLSMALFGTVLAYYAAHRIPGAGTIAGLNWSFLAAHAGQLDKTTMRLAFILALLGYGTKCGLAPMHTWKPDAYSEAPVPAAALLSSATMNCAFYGLIRFYILTSRSAGADLPGTLLLTFGLLSMGVAVPFVLVQKNFRRLLAYCTIEHAGIMATALGIGGKTGTLALMLHMTYHTIAKPLLFLSAGNIYQHFKTDLFAKVKGGVIRVIPVTGIVFFMAILAVIGMPPFSLFQSEFLIVQAAFGAGMYVPTTLFILFGTGMFTGLLLHAGGLVLGPAGDEPAGMPLRPWCDLPVLALAGVLIAAGFWLPGPVFELIQGAARVVTGE